MAAGQKRNVPLVPGAYQALEQFKQEVASELGIQNYQGYLGDIPSRINGAVGGHMVRRMIAAAEQSLIDQATSAVRTGFQAGLSGSGSSGSVPNPSTVSEQGLQPPKV
ncbi:MAG: small, acid-soluble spore protein, alpha/beta type [Limnochordia bacterium]